MPGTLYVVATPIGNLEDITVRALRILREVAVIAAEDTRRTAKLLSHHGIATPTVSFHEHNRRARIPQIIRRLTKGESVALVSDAGTPAIADPGLELVQASIAANISVDPVPGASATLAALVGSGFPTHPVTFEGFAPSRSKDRDKWLAAMAEVPHVIVFFESPHRIATTLAAAASILGTRPLVVARELTKVHQEFLRGTATELVERLTEPKGEFTVVVGPAPAQTQAAEMPAPDKVADEFRHITESVGASRRDAISTLARRYGRPSREIYATLERAKTSVP